MIPQNLFNGLFIFEIANNHMGDIAHGKQIISEIAKISRSYDVTVAVKFQLRNLKTFIHPNYQDNDRGKKLVKRFKETELSVEEFKELHEEVKKNQLLSIATVFDEESISTFNEIGYDALKIASCCAKEIPLLEEISAVKCPAIISTASLEMYEIKRSLEILNRPSPDLGIAHCVGIYPTPNESLMLNRIKYLRESFPQNPIGYSTHEAPDITESTVIATALGGAFFEKHIALPTEKYLKNNYSVTVEQAKKWIEAYIRTKSMMNYIRIKDQVKKEELKNLKPLKRGVYCKNKLIEGQLIKREDVFFAIPAEEISLYSENFQSSIRVLSPCLDLNDSIKTDHIAIEESSWCKLRTLAHKCEILLRQAAIKLPKKFKIEISHQYGLERFEQTGAILVTLFNDNLCKKLIVQFAGQDHPPHYHNDRNEYLCLIKGHTILGFHGNIREINMIAGEYYHVEKGNVHHFKSLKDSVIEEISLGHKPVGSIYLDDSITKTKYQTRKTPMFFNDGRWDYR